MTLTDWAARWNISRAALEDLIARQSFTPEVSAGLTEIAVQSQVRLEAAAKDVRLWRNNVGAGRLENGLFMRWGLANDSSQLNRQIKSADLIGWRRRYISPLDVGTIIAQFVSREIKRSNWAYADTETERAQVAWATLINASGGDARIVTGPGSL